MKKLIIVILSTIASLANATVTLRIGVPEPTYPPIAIISGNRLVGGYLYSIGTQIADSLNATPEFFVIPTKRVETLLNSDAIHLVCHLNPAWLKAPDTLGWTHAIYQISGRIISLRNIPDIHTIYDLSGKRISTVRGYTYPSLAYLWKKHKATRVDEKNIDQMLRAVKHRIADVAIVPDMEFGAWVERHPHDHPFYKTHPIILGTKPTMCAVSPYSPFSVAQLNEAIATVKAKKNFTDR